MKIILFEAYIPKRGSFKFKGALLCSDVGKQIRVCTSARSHTSPPPSSTQQIDVSFLCVCPVIDHEFRHNIVKVAVIQPRSQGFSSLPPLVDQGRQRRETLGTRLAVIASWIRKLL